MKNNIRDSLMVRIRACRVRDRGSIPRRGVFFFVSLFFLFFIIIIIALCGLESTGKLSFPLGILFLQSKNV